MKRAFLYNLSFLLLCLIWTSGYAQICGTAGIDGPVNVSAVGNDSIAVNTYYPPKGNVTLNAGSKSVLLDAVPPTDEHKNSFGTVPIAMGDLLLIIQMQDATINYENSRRYGAGVNNSGPDGLGGTGYTNLGETGRFEYVIATSDVPLSGGLLTFEGAGTDKGAVYTYVNNAATTVQGQRTFQVVRVPQYSTLTLTSNISTPPFNGRAGGIIAF